jgi:hypothetical protein
MRLRGGTFLRVSVPPSSSCLSAAGIEAFKRRRHKKLSSYKNFANLKDVREFDRV